MDEVLAAIGRRARRRVLTLLREVQGHLTAAGDVDGGAGGGVPPDVLSVTSASAAVAAGGGGRSVVDDAFLRTRMCAIRAVFADSAADRRTVESLLRRLESWMPPSTRQLYRETGA